jgi:hypothetical protein
LHQAGFFFWFWIATQGRSAESRNQFQQEATEAKEGGQFKSIPDGSDEGVADGTRGRARSPKNTHALSFFFDVKFC